MIISVTATASSLITARALIVAFMTYSFSERFAFSMITKKPPNMPWRLGLSSAFPNLSCRVCLSLTVRIFSIAAAAYVWTTMFGAPRWLMRRGKRCLKCSTVNWLRKVDTNFTASAFSIGLASMLGSLSSGRICDVKNSMTSIWSFTSLTPPTALSFLTLTASTSSIAASFCPQLFAGSWDALVRRVVKCSFTISVAWLS
mmetsp:Transcript_21297/g.44351  ORF Transcript_21297/g.44351 Transcript_21297/m.44351 type:complete len:200 (+) Transcript_21297:1209-1808(+)